jgi:hypothetical protein
MKKRGTYKVLQGYLKLKKKTPLLTIYCRGPGPDQKKRKEAFPIPFHFLSYLLLPRRQFNAAIK